MKRLPLVMLACSVLCAPFSSAHAYLQNMNDGTIYDTSANLVWLKDANCFGLKGWDSATTQSNTLATGQCGLTDGSAAGEWRLPTVSELRSRYYNLGWNTFTNVQSNYYWTSTPSPWNYNYFEVIDMRDGFENGFHGYYGWSQWYVWPVRAYRAPDTTAPTIATFTIPSTTTNTTVKLAVAASDDVAVTGYMVEESGARPQAGDYRWSPSAPSTYTFTSYGTKGLYLWVKDAAGNIAQAAASTTISVPAPTTWRSLGLDGQNVASIAVDPTDSQTIYVGTYTSGLFKSTDGGGSWTGLNAEMFDRYGSGAVAAALLIDPGNPQSIYAGTGQGVFKSTDGGASWNWTYLLTWSSITNIQCMVMAPDNSQTIYAGTGHGIYKSTDGGANWYSVYGGSGVNVFSVVIDPNNSQTVYASTWAAGVLKTTDGGASWTPMNSGFSTARVLALAIDPSNPQILYATSDYGMIYKTMDGGASWSPVVYGNVAGIGIAAMSLAVDPTDTLSVYAGTTSYYGGSWRTGVIRSRDGGATWEWAGNTIAGTYVNANTVNIVRNQYPATDPSIFAGTDAGIFSVADLTPPKVADFTLPATAKSLSVQLSSFSAADNIKVTGYLLTETAALPAASDPGWTPAPPTSFTFGTSGDKTLYGWARDAAGNVSQGLGASVSVSLDGVCGDKNGARFGTAPQEGLCSVGTATAVTGTTKWSWGCVGENGGMTANCSAIRTFPLTLRFAGTGSGSTNGTLSCTSSASCPSQAFDFGTKITLFASPSAVSLFTGWSGACTATAPCTFTMDGAKSVTTSFKKAPVAKIGTTGYDLLSSAYAGASSTATILALGTDLTEAVLTLNGSKNITLRGGYLADYSGRGDLPTVLHGRLLVRSGKVVIDRLYLR